jgi:hypothetical protein
MCRHALDGDILDVLGIKVDFALIVANKPLKQFR